MQANNEAKPGNNGIIINILLDESGSMQYTKDRTIEMYNNYTNSQINNENCFVSLNKFNGTIEQVYTNLPIAHIPQLTINNYKPKNGMTNLLDAIGVAITQTDTYLNSLSTDEEAVTKRPAVLIVILTDGHENASRIYTQSQINTMITTRQNLGWTFVFLGANIDAWNTASSMGIPQANAFNFNTNDQSVVSDVLGRNTTQFYNSVRQFSTTQDGVQRAYSMAERGVTFFNETDRVHEAPIQHTFHIDPVQRSNLSVQRQNNISPLDNITERQYTHYVNSMQVSSLYQAVQTHSESSTDILDESLRNIHITNRDDNTFESI
jgi:hypothetical protein